LRALRTIFHRIGYALTFVQGLVTITGNGAEVDEGQRVSYSVENGPKGPQAANVVPA